MFARLAPCRAFSRCATLKPIRQVHIRRFLASQCLSSSTPATSKASALVLLTSELDKISPGFGINGDQINIIRGPSEFYDTLKAKILTAKRQIFISTLYIGKKEYELIDTLAEALRKNPTLKLSILTDALRGTRETPDASCASLLAPLVEEFGQSRVQICMFHTPNLTGIRKLVIPKRINEGWGLQHMKLYGFDDELIISGANLSQDYFTNRQDRYHLFNLRSLADFFYKIHDSVCSLSFQILPSSDQAGYTMTWPETNPCPSPLENPTLFRKTAKSILAPLLKPQSQKDEKGLSNPETKLYPVLQLTPLLKPDTSTELPALQSILQQLASSSCASELKGCSWTFTAGYFNMTPSFRRLLLATDPARGTIIAASPWANGFFGSAGISGMLPAAYTHLSKRFIEAVRRNGLSSQIKLKEWQRGIMNEPGGWTYHAKGLWLTLPGESQPSLSIIGSSNYTKRSYELDLEANVIIATTDKKLKKRLRKEERYLQRHAHEVDEAEFAKPERHVSWNVRAAMWTVRVLGGAL